MSMLLDDADDALEVDVDEEAAAETLLVAPCSCERKTLHHQDEKVQIPVISNLPANAFHQ